MARDGYHTFIGPSGSYLAAAGGRVRLVNAGQATLLQVKSSWILRTQEKVSSAAKFSGQQDPTCQVCEALQSEIDNRENLVYFLRSFISEHSHRMSDTDRCGIEVYVGEYASEVSDLRTKFEHHRRAAH